MNRKRLLTFMIIFTMIIMMLPTFNLTAFAAIGTWEGTGAQADPWLIKTTDDFVQITTTYSANNGYKDKFFKLVNNLDFTGVTYTPAGTAWGASFNASFDGNNKEFTNLTMTTSGRAGIFGYLSYGTIKDLTLRSGTITGAGGVGAIASEAQGQSSITNCKNYASVTGTSNVGGMLGYAKDIYITDCYNGGSISGTTSVGGIAGTLSANTRITNCSNEGSLTDTGNYTGGIVGSESATSIITNCYNNATIDKGRAYTGGIVGQLSVSGKIDGCYNNGAITALYNDLGGIVGKTSGEVVNCYNLQPVTATGKTSTGGIAGETATATGFIHLSYNKGTITNGGDCGGIVGKHAASAIVSDCYNLGSVVGSTAAGIAGSVSSSKVLNSYSAGSTSSGCIKWQSGGIFANLFYNKDLCTTDLAAAGSTGLYNADFASGKVAALLNANHVDTALTPSPASIWSNDTVKPIFADTNNYAVYQYVISGVGSGYTVYVKLAPASQMNVIVASYTGDMLVDVSSKTDTVGSGTFAVKENFATGNSLKIMFWDGYNNAKPLGAVIAK